MVLPPRLLLVAVRWAQVACAALAVCGGLTIQAAEPSADDLEFFERKIRPLLAAHCHECHGPRKSQANLRLDHAAGWLTGGDSGPALVPGKPDKSLLVRAVRYADLEMPPDGKLTEPEIDLLEEWVRRGAPAPSEDPLGARAGIDLEEGRKFWAYQPPRAAPLPAVRQRDWPRAPWDCFILARLEAAGIAPSPPAQPAVLVRRLYFDLLGLPPTPEAIAEFAADASPAAYESLVDRLLASPQFGERWGRHWLDVARFGESLTLRGFILPEAWRYRDYCIASFNADLPYDQFVREQIAGDLMPGGNLVERQRRLVATTFLALGNTNLEEQDKRQLDMDVVDEQLDVIGKALLGQTIGCARCHDHKFDPIPTRDYYALAGILCNTQALVHANVSQWTEAPLPLPPDEEAPFAAYEARLHEAESELSACRAEIAELVRRFPQASAATDEVVSAGELPGVVVDDAQAERVGQWEESSSVKPYIGQGYLHDRNQDKGEKTLTFRAELPTAGRYAVRLAYTASSNRAGQVPVTVVSSEGEQVVTVDMRAAPPVEGRFAALGEFRFEKNGPCLVRLDNDGTDGHVVADAVQFLPLLEQADGEAALPMSTEPPAELIAAKGQLKQLEAALKKLRSAAPRRPMVMTVLERSEVRNLPVHHRGSVHALDAEPVPRGFLQVIPGQPLELPDQASGRLELAQWLTAREQPLAARVWVNRTWHWLMGEGLVRTVDNLGTTGDRPTHPELLDYLAVQFVEQGWSVKQLVRSLVLSQTYRQSSAERDEALAIDPENRLCWRAARKRLEAECLRDSMLAVSGQLDLAMGGSTIAPGTKADYDYVDRGTRRSVYVPVMRNALCDLLEAFDAPEPSLVVGSRNTSTVAPQALLLMNHPFVRAQAEAAAQRLPVRAAADRRLDYAFLQVLGRTPSPREREIAQATVASGDLAAWTDLYHLLFMSLDFRYRD